MKREIKKASQEDVRRMLCKVLFAIDDEFYVTDEQLDKLETKLHPILDEFFGCPDYRNYN